MANQRRTVTFDVVRKHIQELYELEESLVAALQALIDEIRSIAASIEGARVAELLALIPVIEAMIAKVRAVCQAFRNFLQRRTINETDSYDTDVSAKISGAREDIIRF